MTLTFDDIKNLIEHLTKIEPNAIEQNGYSMSKDSAVAFLMVFLCGLDGFSEGSLEVPTHTSLGHLDHTGGGLYVGPQIPLVLITLMANGYIALRQMLNERRTIDSEKIYPKQQATLEANMSIFADWHDVLSNSTSDNSNFVELFEAQYKYALHQQIIANMNRSQPTVLDRWQVSDPNTQALNTAFEQFNQLHQGVSNQYPTLNKLLRGNVSQVIAEFKTLPEDSLIYQVKDQIYDSFQLVEYERLQNDHPKGFRDETIFYVAMNDLLQIEMDENKKDALIQAWAKSYGFIAKLEQDQTQYEFHYLKDQFSYRFWNALGRWLGNFNVLVNVGIGVGAFVGICAVIYALTGFSLVASLSGWPLLLLMATFAMIAAVGAYLITRRYIMEVFARLSYQWQVFWYEEDKWSALKASFNDKNILTALVTLPTSIGITIIETVAFMVSMPVAPWVLPIAALISVITFIACMSLFGSMFYDTYPRLKKMLTDPDNLKKNILPALMVMLMVMAAIVTFCLMCNPISSFLVLAPVSAVFLMVVLAAVIMTVALSFQRGWSMNKTNLTAIGLVVVIGQVLAILCSSFMLFGLGPAIAIAALSFPMFFSWAVLTVASPDKAVHKEAAMHWLEGQGDQSSTQGKAVSFNSIFNQQEGEIELTGMNRKENCSNGKMERA